MSDENLLIRLAALERENSALRGQPAKVEEPPRSKMEVELAKLQEAARELAKDIDPMGDPVAQVLGRTRYLAQFVAVLAGHVTNHLGASKMALGKIRGDVDALRADVESLRVESVQQSQPLAQAPEDLSTQETPAPAPAQKSNGRAAGKRPAAPPQPTAPPVPGMPAEVAVLTPPSAGTPIATVTVK